jgi:hypothetical protein
MNGHYLDETEVAPPDVLVSPTVEDVVNGTDTDLQTVLNLIDESQR